MGYDDGFRWTEWGRNKQQTENISYLEGELNRQRSADVRTQRALKAQLTQLSGDLTARIDTVSRALDSFMELSDLRFELQIHQPAAVLRAEVRRFLVAASDSSEVPAFHADDVPGYWLRPASAALAALLAGGDAGPDLAAAHDLDRHRTDLFLTVSLALTGRPEASAAHLPGALGSYGGALTRAQLTLWKASARGHLGERGREIVADWMRGHVAASGAVEEKLTAFALKLRGDTQVTAPAASHAAARLTRLTELSAAALAGELTGGAPGDLFRLIEELVDEGAPLEAPLLLRSRILRHQVETRSPGAEAPERFTDPAGPVEEIVTEAITDEEGPVRASAVALVAPALLRVGGRLLAETEGSTDPGTRTVKRAGVSVEVREDGADPAGFAEALRVLESRDPAPSTLPWMIAAGIGVVFVIGSVALGLIPLAVLLAVGLGFPAWKWYDAVKTAREAAGTNAYVRSALEKDVAEARKDLADRRRRAVTAAADAAGIHAELVKALR